MRAIALAFSILLVTGCAMKGNLEAPADLVKFQSTLTVERLWSTGLGGNADTRVALAPVFDGERLFAAGNAGQVVALSVENGRRIWVQKLDVILSGGPGRGAGLVVVGGADGSVVALDAETGAVRWRQRVTSEVLAAPAVSGQIVLVRSADERVYALDAADGGQLWVHEQTMPSLVLRGSAGFAVADSVAITGYDNGRVNALQVRDGQLVWETPVVTPTGRTEIERMVDVNATPRIIGRDVYAVSYQGRLVALARETGRVLWSQELSSSAGLTADGTSVYVTDADSEVRAFDRFNGARSWHQPAMRARSLTAPVVVGDAVAVGDFDGWVHLLSRSSGELVARVRAGSGPIHSAPVALGPWLLVQTAGGTLTAFRVGAE